MICLILLSISGDSKATIRTLDGNVLIDPFEPEFIINIPITFEWGLPLSGQYTPSFQIKDLDNSPVFSESSYRQTWTYQNDMRLDFRSDLEGQRMISPTLTDQDIQYQIICIMKLVERHSSALLLVVTLLCFLGSIHLPLVY